MNKSKRFWISLACSVPLIALLVIGQQKLSRFINGDNPGKISVAELRGMFAELPMHAGDSLNDGPNAFGKESIVGVTAHASSTATIRDLLGYYKNVLAGKGWSLREEADSEDHGKIRLCRNHASLTIDASSLQAGTSYYIGLVWTRYRMSADFCD